MAEVLFTEARPGVLSPRMRALLSSIADAAGLPSITILKGSWCPPDTYSAGTHSGGGAADIGRIWEFGGWNEQQAVAHHSRAHGCLAYVRNQEHGGMEPHIHIIATGEPNLHPEALWQLDEYALGHDALASRGPDYHPYRPILTPWKWESDMELTDRVDLTESTRTALGVTADSLTVSGLLQRAASANSALTVAKRNAEQLAVLRAEVAGLRAAINAAGPGVDMTAVSAAAAKAVADALKDLTITIE